ncbi:MAG: hypothetical protein Kow0042_14160 [Calditrichia bacterium]
MSYKPGDVFIGVIDFFAILLPGALLVFFLIEPAKTHLFGKILPSVNTEVQAWVVFLFAAYLFGHFIFLLGSKIDFCYDLYRKRFLSSKSDEPYKSASIIRDKMMGKKDAEKICNTFQWSKANVQLFYPEAAREIHRLEADSKFFRSLIVVLFLVGIILFGQTAWIEGIICFALMILSFLRYADQRWKSTRLAYIYLIALPAKKAVSAKD